MSSLWSEHTQLPVFGQLQENIKTDVLIIGGGLAGLLCAHRLRELGVECVVVEADRICSGVTRNTTAKLTAQHGLVYAKLMDELGREGASAYLKANLAALDHYHTLCGHIDCDYEEKDSYVYSRTDRAKVERELKALRALGYPAQLAETVPLPFSVAGAVKFPHQAQFDPLKFVAAIARDLTIYENTPVWDMKPHRVRAGSNTITAKNVVVTTHFPILNRHGWYFLKLYQHRSYVIALKNAPDVGGMYVDDAETGLSFRNASGLLLLGGGGHRTGKKGGGWEDLTRFARRHWPKAREVCRWATQDCMSLDGAPYIGRYAKNTPGLYVATGFNKWGMTTSMAAALLLGDLLTGRENPWEAAFDPSRSIFRPQLAANIGETAVNFLTPTRPRCPHLGCALKWNEAERTWDCPCHGSRFAANGQLLDDPATGDLKI